MNDKIISGQNSLFTRKGSLIKCVKDCALIPNCVSVFYSKLVCKGYPVVYQPSSPNLISMQGIRYYACVEIYSGFSMTSSTDIFVQNSTTQISTDNSNQESITTDVTTKESSAETTSKTTTNISVQDSTTQISTDDSSQNTVITDVTTKESSPETTSQLPISTLDTSSPLYSTTLMTTTSLQCKSLLSFLVITSL